MVASNTISKRPIADGDKVAKKYVMANLSSEKMTGDVIYDGWNDNPVQFDSTLYGTDDEDYEALYYVVTLEEPLEHIFSILDNFDITQVDSRVMAVAKISHVKTYKPLVTEDDEEKVYRHGPTLYDQMQERKVAETYTDWDQIKKIKGSNSAADDRSVITAGAHYKLGNHHRVELSILNGYGMSFSKGKTNTKNNVKQYLFDDLFIDYQGEITGAGNFKNVDFDKIHNTNWDYGDTLTDNEQYNYRVHVPIDIQVTYNIREGKYPPDPLYARIESDTVENRGIGRSNMNSVRQIIISVNADNYKEPDKHRPIIFFYDGPEQGTLAAGEKSKRPYLPVILNLNEDFRGVLFAPNNPVVINGNGHKFEGFVVGKYFTQLMTESDFEFIELLKVSYREYDYYIKKDELSEFVSRYRIRLKDLTTESIDFYAKKTELAALMTKKGKDALTADDLLNEEDLPRYYKITEESVTYTDGRVLSVPVNPMFVDDHGNVQYTDEILATEDLKEGFAPDDDRDEYKQDDDLTFEGNPFNLSYVRYDSFLQVGLVNYTYLDKKDKQTKERLSTDAFFTTARSQHID